MNVNSVLTAAMKSGGEQPVEPTPSFFTITPKTIRMGHGSEIFQIKNITRVGKYKVAESKFPLALIILFGIGGIGLLMMGGQVSIFLGVVALAIAGIGFWSRSGPDTYAFGFECNSGASRYLRTKDQEFIDEIVTTISQYIESERTDSMQINVDNRTIVNIEDRSVGDIGIVNGNIVTGDTK